MIRDISPKEIERTAETLWRDEAIRKRGRGRIHPWADAHPHIHAVWRERAYDALSALPPSAGSETGER